MKKTRAQIYLSGDNFSRLDSNAKQKGISRSSLVNELISQNLTLKERVTNITQSAIQRDKIRIALSTKYRVKVTDQDIVLLYDSLMPGKSIFASLADDDSKKMGLPVGEYKIKDDRVVVVKEDGIIDHVIVSPKDKGIFRDKVLSKSIK